MTTFVCPAELPPRRRERAQELALAVYELLGCHGVARVDLMLDERHRRAVGARDERRPGLTETSLLPQAADAAGIGFDELGRAGSSASAPSPRSAVAGGEVLGRDLVEELLELLDDVLGLLDVVLELDRRLGDDLLGRVDRRARAHRERDRVARPRVDLELPAADAERDRGEERVLAQLGDRDLGALARRARRGCRTADRGSSAAGCRRPGASSGSRPPRGGRSRSAGTCCRRRSSAARSAACRPCRS